MHLPLGILEFSHPTSPLNLPVVGETQLVASIFSQGSGITLVWPFFACKVVLFWVSPGHWRNSFVSLGCEAFWVFFVFLVRGWLGLYIFFARSWVTIVTRVSLWRVSKLCFLFYDWVLRPSSPSCVTCAGGLRLNGFNLYNGFLW